MTTHTLVKVKFYLDVGELTSRTLAKRLRMLVNQRKTLANKTLAEQLVGKTTGYHVFPFYTCHPSISALFLP